MRVVKALDAGPMLVDGDTADRRRGDERRGRTGSRADRCASAGRSRRPAGRRHGARGAPERCGGDLRPSPDEGRQSDRLGAAGARAARPDSRAASLAARGDVSGRQRLILLRSRLGPQSSDAPHGTIVAARGDDLRVATGDGLLQIVELQVEGRKPMRAARFSGRPSAARPAGVFRRRHDRAGARRRLRDSPRHLRRPCGSAFRDSPRSRASLADERDRALAAEIATGVQRWRAALDYLIGHVAKRPIERLDPEVVEILRLSAYQLLHLTRVPASAVVDDAVKLARRAGKRSADGFVNAVLRTVSRQRNALPLPPRPADPADRAQALDYFSITLSHPAWLAARWLDRLGFAAAEAWMQFNNAAAPLTLRANRIRMPPDELVSRLRERGVVAAPGRFAPDALIVDGGPAAPGARTGGRLVRGPGRSLAARGAARRAVAGPACARHVRGARRQDDGVRRRQSRRADRRLRRQGPAHGAAATHRRGNRRGQRGARAGRPAAAASLHRSVRLRGGRRAVLGSGHAAARSGHPVAAARGGSGRTGRGAAHDAASRRGGCRARRQARVRDLLERTRGERRRGRGVSLDRSGFAPLDARQAHPALPPEPSTIAATCGPSPIATASRRSSGRSWSAQAA